MDQQVLVPRKLAQKTQQICLYQRQGPRNQNRRHWLELQRRKWEDSDSERMRGINAPANLNIFIILFFSPLWRQPCTWPHLRCTVFPSHVLSSLLPQSPASPADCDYLPVHVGQEAPYLPVHNFGQEAPTSISSKVAFRLNFGGSAGG